MDINKIPVGENPPEDCNVLIEVPIGSSPVKYELDKDSGALFVDRFLHTAMHYPCNYGFIPHTLSDDGDPIDVMIVSRRPILPGAVVSARPIGVLIMEDEKGEDEKILAVPSDRLHPYYSGIRTYTELPEILLDQITHFFEHYKDLEKEKWVKVKRWGDDAEARKMIEESMKRADEKSSAA
ncbi:MAG: inorganic diphosphatase [Pseudomonadota bacterium]|uniref:inorganic diphosphatase n=1 Tax=Fodinicurvata fenggangensis TaxID=1121830 RepID=UPI00047CE42A|nr:inorganic diphosphatase [Fodinicurvata fenggangensis]